MKTRVKRLINFRFDQYKDIEIRLEKLAAKGLFLEECHNLLWSFRRGEPKHLKYTVTYFSEGSLFNPHITDNQQSYFEYAKAAGWEAVTQFNQMQIFCSDAENPVPFETDEKEKLENIKKCMKKSFLPSVIVLIVVFLFNLIVQIDSFRLDAIGFLSDPNRLLSAAMILAVIFYNCYALLDYFIWCQRSAQSITNGGTCIENTGTQHRIIDGMFLCCILGILAWFIFNLAVGGNWFILILGIAQIPILLIVFWSSIKYLKKKKASAMVNRALSFAALLLASFAYLTFIVLFIIRFDFPVGNTADYRTVTWDLSATESHDYKLYSHEIPLTCEDLYGQIEYDYYSYEKRTSSTIFLTQNNYFQDTLPAKNAPPRLEYNIIETQFDFVYTLVRDQLLAIPDWRHTSSFKAIDNEIFGTVEAYQEYYDYNSTGRYLLFFEDKIVDLNMEDLPTANQILVIRDKLQF